MIRKIILSIAAILLLWFGCFFYYLYYTRSYQIDKSAVTDAIIVFTGGANRIDTGIGLLKAGYAPLLFISGIGSPTQLKNFLTEHGVKQEQVIYGLTARDTKGNALEIAEFINKSHISSIRLVTSSYHMPRALTETQRLLATAYPVVIIPHPVFSEYYNYKLCFKEYNKYLIIKIFNIN